MSVDAAVIDRKDRSFFSGNVVSGSAVGVCNDILNDDPLPDCPPGFENAVGWGFVGFEGLCESEMHGNDLCGIGDEIRYSADSSTVFVDRKLVDFTQKNVTSAAAAASDYKMETRRKRDAKEVMVKSGCVVSSLVWGKIRSHPWWPGQIFDPADLSKEALRHYKDGKFLVAYFGGGTFAWNDATQIRPFQLNFEKMESQSELETFCWAVDCALNEVFRRVEFGLACSCMPENVYADIQSQIVENSGIYKKSRRRDAEDEYSSAACFVPSILVSYVKAAATFPNEVRNKLEMVKCKAQLTSFCRWKGYRKPPEYTYFRGLLDNHANFAVLDSGESHTAIANSAVNARRVVPSKFAITEGKGKRQVMRRGRPKGTAKQKRKKISYSDDDELYVPPTHVKVNWNAKRKVRLEAPTPEIKTSTSICRSGKMKLDRGSVISAGDSCITPAVGRNVADLLSPDVLFKKLALTAADPLHDHDGYSILVFKFFSQFRNSIWLNHPVSAEPRIPVDKKSDEMMGKVIPEYIYRTPQGEHVEESCSMDQVIKESAANKCSMMDPHDEPPSVVTKNLPQLNSPILELEIVPQLHVFPDPKTEDTNSNQESAEGILSTPDNQGPDKHNDKKMLSKMRTALLLKFSEHGHVPSVTDLNKIFSCYGPVHESETKIMKRNLAKVIFMKHHDAEVAFSSTGKYNIFGPSLISYRLKYLTTKPNIISSQSRKRRKKAVSIEEGNPT